MYNLLILNDKYAYASTYELDYIWLYTRLQAGELQLIVLLSI